MALIELKVSRVSVSVAVVFATLLTLPRLPVATAADLPESARQSTSPTPSALEAYVRKNVEIVQAGGANASTAREELCRQAEAGNVIPSAAFQLEYVKQIRAAITPLIGSDKVVDRLNGAIIVCRLAKATSSNQLQPEVVTLCGDRSPAVALWGVKAAGALLPSVMSLSGGAANQTLTKAVFDAVKAHDASVAIVEDAYRSLDLVNNASSKLPKESINIGTAAIVELLRYRIEKSSAEAGISPEADRDAALYLGNEAVIKSADAADKPAVLKTSMAQALLDLASVYSARGGEAKDLSLRKAYHSTIVASGSSLKVHLLIAGNREAASRLDPLMRVNPNGLRGALPVVADVGDAVKQVYPELKAAATLIAADAGG